MHTHADLEAHRVPVAQVNHEARLGLVDHQGARADRDAPVTQEDLVGRRDRGYLWAHANPPGQEDLAVQGVPVILGDP